MITLYCLHGFLGRASDWDWISRQLAQEGVRTECPDFFAPESIQPTGLSSLGSAVNQRAALSAGPKVIMGYSLGGRIALHALQENPALWSGAILISTHPGLQSESAREMRLKWDFEWARKFENEPWERVIQEWNAQPVFERGGIPPLRLASEFSRAALADSLRECSLGRQRDFRPSLQNFQLPILWMVGQRDTKFMDLSEEIADLNLKVERSTVENAGHRVPWDQPEVFVQKVLSFLIPERTQYGKVD